MPDAALSSRRFTHTWRTGVKGIRRGWLKIVHDQRIQAGVVGALLSLSLVLLALLWKGPFLGSATSTRLSIDEDGLVPGKGRPSLFIAIGSAPRNADLRNAARSSWLKWLPKDSEVKYRFFSDAPPSSAELQVVPDLKQVWSSLHKENVKFKDIVQQPLPGGYGNKEHNAYAQRARYQVKWALNQFPELEYFLRIDDDSFLCLHKLIYELKSLPKRQFIWGRFWCRQGRNRADENFMLFSNDIVRLLANDDLIGNIVPYDDEVTLGWNLGYWSWVLNVTIFDDQHRLDAQQGYLTDYMHAPTVPETSTLMQFCEKFIYAHHVKAATIRAAGDATVTHMMYPLPEHRGPSETCPRQSQSFVPSRHSSALPDLLISRAAPRSRV